MRPTMTLFLLAPLALAQEWQSKGHKEKFGTAFAKKKKFGWSASEHFVKRANEKAEERLSIRRSLHSFLLCDMICKEPSDWMSRYLHLAKATNNDQLQTLNREACCTHCTSKTEKQPLPSSSTLTRFFCSDARAKSAVLAPLPQVQRFCFVPSSIRVGDSLFDLMLPTQCDAWTASVSERFDLMRNSFPCCTRMSG